MLNTQIPSGLQALMQAAQILQQEASPTAPGPQGQQPTVASQIQQAASQQAMPDMQMVGQQAGLAGQLMAQRQQQQQQMAQDPQAVAQMAAQMLKQGVGGLPSNMQFREGGIIGYAGEEGSDVRLQPISDREDIPLESETMAEKAIRQLEEKGSIYDPFYGLPPAIRQALKEDVAAQREGTARPESYTIPGRAGSEEIPRPRAERERLEAQAATRSDREQAMQDLAARRRAQRQGVEAALSGTQLAAAQTGGANYTPYPKRGEMRVSDSKPSIASVLESEFQRGKEAGAEPRPAFSAAPEAKTGIAQEIKPAAPSVPSVARPAAPTFAGIMQAIPEDTDLKKAIQDSQAVGERMLQLRKGQEDLSAQGIAALQRAEDERKRLREQQKGQDSFNSLMALARSFQTRGDEYMAYKTGMQARDEANRIATLANDEAVLKLKQAQQAKAMGDLELEKKLKDEAVAAYRQGQNAKLEVAKATADLAGKTFAAETQAASSEADRANQLKMKVMELQQRAADAQDIRLSNQLSSASQRLSVAQRNIAATLEKEFPEYNMLSTLAGVGGKLSDDQKATLKRISERRTQLETQMIAPIEGLIVRLSKQAGIELPAAPAASSAPTIRYDAQGKRIQ